MTRKLVSLFDVAEITAKQVDPREVLYADMPLVAPDHVESETGRIIAFESASSQEAISGKYLVEPTDVIYSKIRPYLMKATIAGKPALCSADMYPISCSPKILPEFLCQLLLSPRFTQFAVSCSNRTGIPKVNREELAQFQFSLPPLTEQQRVVDITGAADRSIALTQQLLDATSQRQKGLMQQLLTGRQRLKGFRKAWPKYRLRDLFTEVNRQPSTPVPVLSISAGRGFLSQKERFNREVSAATLANYTLIERGEFAYNKGNSKTYTCGCIYALNEFESAAIPSVYISFSPTTPINTRFFEFFFEADMLKAQLTRIINSGVRNDGLLNLATKDFFNMQIQVPDLNEQAAIAEVLNQAAEAARLQRQQLQALQQQKRALLQRLLSGEPT